MIAINEYKYKRDVLDTIDKPKDKDRWTMNPQDVNAYYNPQRNEIVFPAGILQKPFFALDNIDNDLDKYIQMSKNYGGIGVIIAHELTHGYDDQGSKFDYNGNIRNWWKDDDKKKFRIIEEQMIEQYNEYNINGELTLGENLADLGGITLAFRALEKQLKDLKDLKQKKQIYRYFFISFANIWKTKTRHEKDVSQLYSDFHSMAKYRVFILRNIDEFYDLFYNENDNECNDSKKSMYLEPQKRIKLW